MKKESLKQTIQQGFAGLFHICKQELKAVFKDQGVLIFFLLVPLATRWYMPLFIPMRWYEKCL